MIPTVVAIVWMLGSFIVGLFCIHRKLGFWGGFFFSVLLSPIIMILILMMTEKSTNRTLKT